MRTEHAVQTDLGVLGLIHPLARGRNTAVIRGPEDALIYNEHHTEEKANPNFDLELCTLHKLPKGMSCPLRIEKNGLYFCKNKNECAL